MREMRNRSGRISVAGLFLLLVILLAGTVAGVAAYMFWPRGDEVFSYIRVSMSPESIVYEKEPASKEDYEIFKNTQMGLVKSPYVFKAALRKKKIGNLSIVKQEIDPISWLENELQVECLNNSEIMKVSLTSKKPKEAAELVNAVVDAYIKEVVHKQDSERRAMVAQLTQIYNSKENEVRTKRASLNNLSEKLGVAVDGSPSARVLLALQDHDLYQKELLSAQLELNQATASRDLYKARLDEIDEGEKTSSKYREYVKSQPGTPALGKEYSAIVEQLDGIAARTNSAHVPKKVADDLEAFRRKFHAWHDKVLDSLRAEVIEKIDKQQTLITVLSENVKKLERGINEKKEVTLVRGNSSVDVEMMRGEVESLEESLRNIAKKREKLDIESRTRPRIMCVQMAQPPENSH